MKRDKPIQILYVEDNIFDRLLVRRALEAEDGDFQVTEVVNWFEFSQRLTEGEYDLVLSDFDLVRFDGWAVLERVKEKHPTLPVIFISGTSIEGLEQRAFERGVSEFIHKSNQNIKNLPQTIKRVLQDL